jgi:hypothetical protein
VYRLLQKYPDNLQVRDEDDGIHESLHTQFTKIFINAKGAKWDGFSFFHLKQKSKSLLISFQMKLAEPTSSNPQVISYDLVRKEFDKAYTSYEFLCKKRKPTPPEWVLIIMSNAKSTTTTSNDDFPNKCAVIDHSNFHTFFGQTFASRVQFATGMTASLSWYIYNV